MILKEKRRRACLIIIFKLHMFCGWDVLYLFHQQASSWEASWKPQKTSTKEAVFQQFKPRTLRTRCATIKHHTTSQKSGGENSLYRVVWQVEHASQLSSKCVLDISLCCLHCHKISNPALITLGILTLREMKWIHVQRRTTTIPTGNSICIMLPFLNSHTAVQCF